VTVLAFISAQTVVLIFVAWCLLALVVGVLIGRIIDHGQRDPLAGQKGRLPR
jgi:hypothetical protein